MTNEEYHQLPGLSNSGLTDLFVSPLRYWHLHINPDRPEVEDTEYQQFGSAVHCAVLEPNQFPQRYCQKIHPEPDTLVTVNDMRAYLAERGVKAKGTLKAGIIQQVLDVVPDAPIFDLLEADWERKNAGKISFGKDDWTRVLGAARSLSQEPIIREILEKPGEYEKVYQVEYKGVKLRAMMDFVTCDITFDSKTLTARRGRRFDESVTQAIWHEKYYWQAYFYSLVRSLAGDGKSPEKAPPFVLAFVESDAPHETRIRECRPKTLGEVNMLWHRARTEVEALIEQYAEYQKHFGEKPWRYAQQSHELLDEEFPALAYS